MKKHILYLTQFYASDQQSGGLRHFAHVNSLVEAGYKVSLVISYVDHMNRSVPEEYKGKKVVKEKVNDNLTVYKTYAFPNYGKDIISRLKNMCSYSYYAYLASKNIKNVDLIIGSSPPLPIGLASFIISKEKKAPFIFEVRDLWPDSPIEMGYLKNKALINIAKIIETLSYKQSSAIIVVTQGMKERIIVKGIREDKIFYIPNGADINLYGEVNCKKNFGLTRNSEEEFILTYAGVHSSYPDLQNLLKAANLLKHQSGIKIVLVGDGDNKPQLLQMKEEMNLYNVIFFDRQPKKDIPAILNSSDACIVSYQPLEFWRHAFPNKTFDYMASARPIIASVLDGEITALIKNANCGLSVEPGNPEKLAEAITWMYQNRNQIEQLGRNGRTYIENTLNRNIIIKDYLKLIENQQKA